jgi:ABC-type molybdate transport system substrate-binding protein
LRGLGSAALVEAVLAKPNTRHPWTVHHREIPQMLADGEADVAPLYRHLADYLVAHLPQTFALVALPDAGNVRDELAAAILRDAPRALAAKAWDEFLQGPAAAAILARHGFDRPGQT